MDKKKFFKNFKTFMKYFLNSGLYTNNLKLPGDKGYQPSQSNLKHVLKVAREAETKKVNKNIADTSIKDSNEYSKVKFTDNIQKPKQLSLDFNNENVKMGFIYSEILGEPKCKRRRRG